MGMMDETLNMLLKSFSGEWYYVKDRRLYIDQIGRVVFLYELDGAPWEVCVEKIKARWELEK